MLTRIVPAVAAANNAAWGGVFSAQNDLTLRNGLDTMTFFAFCIEIVAGSAVGWRMQ